MQNSINQKSSDLITLESIYESVSEIGEHFKKLIQLFGAETFEALIPCVVGVLENLEDVTIQRNNCFNLIDKLHLQIEELQKEHFKRIQEQLKYQSEIEEIDEIWRKENGKLEQYVKYLKLENNRLSLLRTNEKYSHSLIDIKEETAKSSATQIDLTDTQLDKLKTKLRILSNEIELKNEEIENLRNENVNLKQENKNLRNIVSLSLTTIIDSNNYEEISVNNEVELKDKIKILEEKLSFYKSKLMLRDELIETEEQHNNVNNVIANVEPKSDIKMEDLPVQGPIPKEPDEKLYWPNRYRKSRIWSFLPNSITKTFLLRPTTNNNK